MNKRMAVACLLELSFISRFFRGGCFPRDSGTDLKVVQADDPLVSSQWLQVGPEGLKRRKTSLRSEVEADV